MIYNLADFSVGVRYRRVVQREELAGCPSSILRRRRHALAGPKHTFMHFVIFNLFNDFQYLFWITTINWFLLFFMFYQPIVKTGFKKNQNIILKSALAVPVRHDLLEKCDASPISAFIKIEKTYEMVKSGLSGQQVITEGVWAIYYFFLYACVLYIFSVGWERRRRRLWRRWRRCRTIVSVKYRWKNLALIY